MERKTTGKIIRFLLCICVFSFLLLAAGKTNVYADNNCIVMFNDLNGTSTDAAFEKLKMTVAENTIIVLPEIEAEKGYTNLGWSTQKGVSTSYHKFKSEVRIKGNVIFYLVRKKNPNVTASFFNNTGGTNAAYKKMAKTVSAGMDIILPKSGKISGYVNMGWTTAKGKTKPLYKEGSKFTLTADTKFYIVRKRTFTTSFADCDGNAGSLFDALKTTVAYGSSITLPEVPNKEGYVGLGWATEKNSSVPSYAAGNSYKVTKNTELYAVYSASFTVKYMNNDGSAVIRTVSVQRNTATKLIGHHEKGYTMMGWSTVPHQKLGAKYMVGQSVTIRKNVTFYAVMFNKKEEINYTSATLPQIDIRHYTKVIFVGDSRTTIMKEKMQNEIPASVMKGTVFISRRGSKITWLKNTGYPALLNEVGKGGTIKKPIAIIFNSGVNDLLDINDYIKFMKKIAPELQEKNCKLYYMSVNPVNNVVLTNRGKNVPEERVRSFNKKIKTYLCNNGPYIYIDTYNELYANGFGHANESGIDDGIHFTTKTYKQIYAHVVKTLNEK